MNDSQLINPAVVDNNEEKLETTLRPQYLKNILDKIK